ncbi:DUF3426 domain-containing protein [Ramlibacter sp. H39-3-26]|uniref:DUF3426 domain-containing protein n=1 Tax=Curvibacter soli TaxID=3031331 RepID=UPI0023DCA3F5|nr:DUF3426 domain-containing protein [Ramlibacter sp. H39-3-26]MDF1484776.1 DUF3426 domain-containing protein [Ramlibacter sp. H39-3-26]
MSQITRCPACRTMFKVVPDQLRISEGWVRCGRCAEVFDASTHLQSMPPAPVLPPASAPAAPPVAAPASTPSAEIPRFLRSAGEETVSGVGSVVRVPAPAAIPSAPAPAAAEEKVGGEAAFALLATAPAAPFSPPKPDASAGTDELALLDDGSAFPSPRSQIGGDGLAVQEPPVMPKSATASPRHASQDGMDADMDAEAADVSFMRAARRRVFWRRPLVRLGLGTVFIVLLAGLAAQVGVQERDRLAAWQPRLQPLLAALCRPLECSIAPFRQIDAMVIDSSSFSKLRGDAYQLAVALKNTAVLPLATPSVELTLTDAQDQPVLRRVLRPQDLNAPAVLSPGGEWSATVALRIAASPASSPPRVAGYRLLAFYP